MFSILVKIKSKLFLSIKVLFVNCLERKTRVHANFQRVKADS